jgi:hypothetical protein
MANDVVVQEGSLGREMFFLVNGNVNVTALVWPGMDVQSSSTKLGMFRTQVRWQPDVPDHAIVHPCYLAALLASIATPDRVRLLSTAVTRLPLSLWLWGGGKCSLAAEPPHSKVSVRTFLHGACNFAARSTRVPALSPLGPTHLGITSGLCPCSWRF